MYIVEYADKVLWDFPEEMNKIALMPDADYLFHLREEPEAKKLKEE